MRFRYLRTLTAQRATHRGWSSPRVSRVQNRMVTRLPVARTFINKLNGIPLHASDELHTLGAL